MLSAIEGDMVTLRHNLMISQLLEDSREIILQLTLYLIARYLVTLVSASNTMHLSNAEGGKSTQRCTFATKCK